MSQCHINSHFPARLNAPTLEKVIYRTVRETTVSITGCSEVEPGSALAVTFRSDGYHVYATARQA